MSDGAVLRFTILGCGSSPGTPRIGGDWGNCDPDNPKNRRRRSSLLVQRIAGQGVTTVVVDTGPDFREQMLDANVDFAEGVFYTHGHADHIHGIDDLRGFAINRQQRVDIYADEPTSRRLHQGFGYCFETPPGGSYPAILREHRLVAGKETVIDGEGGAIRVLPFEQIHGDIVSLGFRFGNAAYSSDISGLSNKSIMLLKDLEVWVVDALQYRGHPSHFSLEQSLDWIKKLAPERAILTHMHTPLEPLDYETVMAETPDHVEPGFDGLQFEVAD